MKNNSYSSDFIANDVPQTEQRQFANIQDFHISPSGYNRILFGERYGKLHIIKTLQDCYMEEPFYQRVLYKEFNIGYQLEHPNICRTLGWENITGVGQCIIQEYIDGITLKTLLEKGSITKELSRKIIIELCEALQYLHKKQIVHRDLKPSNILITHNGENVKLIDFGLSDCDDYDILKLPAGTRYYMAPEVLTPGTPLNSRSDIYSLGIIMGEIANQLNDKQLASISKKCTQRIPEKRYASVTEIIYKLKDNNKHSWIFSKRMLLSIFALVFLSIGCILHFTSPKQPFPSYPVYGEATILNRKIRTILSEERFHLKNSEDSLRITQRLKAALDEEYPLPKQKESQAYRLQWKNVQTEIMRLQNKH